MAWRKPTMDDLCGTLSQVEVDEYKASPEFEEQSDPVARILEDTAEMVRGYCRRLENKGGIKLHPQDGFIPSGLMNPAMDIAAFKVLKRFNLTITDARQKSFDAAVETLRDVADEKMIPESYVDETTTDDEVSGMVPLYGLEFNPHTLDAEQEFVP